MFVIGLAAVILLGTLVGVESAVAVFVHPALWRLSPDAHASVGKPLASVLGRWMPVWYAAATLTTLAAAVVEVVTGSAGWWLAAVAGVLLLATVGVTLVALAPLNRRIAELDLATPFPDWMSVRRTWDRRHEIRVGVLIVSLILLATSLVVTQS